MDILEPVKAISSAFQRMPAWQALALIVIYVLFFGGSHLVLSAHYRRTGRPKKKVFGFPAFPFSELNVREWLLISTLMVCTLGAIALIL